MSPNRSRRRSAVLLATTMVATCIVSALGANPAAAADAPLVTEDGVGIRIDENAILGPALEAIEDELQPFVDQMIYDGAVENSPAGTPKDLHVSSNLELDFDFIDAGTSGYPDGGLSVHADIEDILIEYVKDPVWPWSDCSIYVEPLDATIDASAAVDRAKLPSAPLTINPIQAFWDDDPSVDYTGVCWWWLIDDFFDDIFGSGDDGSIADNIEDELNATAQDLIDDLWNEYVTPVVDSLDSFGITFGQIRTDDHGLIVTADVNATDGLTIPGFAGGPYDVTNTEDSGATSNVNTLLANRGEIIASIHPNVVNQYLNALHQALASQYGQPQVNGPAIEALLLDPSDHASYDDTRWSSRITTTSAPYTTPTGAAGVPEVQFPQFEIAFFNRFTRVATFTGSMSDINLMTELRAGSADWGPALATGSSGLSVTRTQANADASQMPVQSSSQVLPYARDAVDAFNDNIFVAELSLAPISIGGLTVDLCTTCGRYTGDQRYTESFHVG